MSEDKAVRRALSKYKTIVCSFCLDKVDDAFFSWASGVCICTRCLAFSTEEVAKAKKTQAIAEDLGKLVTKLTVTKESKPPEVTQKDIINEIKLILSGPVEPDDAA